MRNLYLAIFLSLPFFLIASQSAFASEEFLTSYDVTYNASLDGKLEVGQEVSLTNKFSNIYATEYSFTLEKGNPRNILAYDQNGPLEVNTSVQDNRTIISVRFKEQVVGKDKTLKFNLQYEFPELLRHSGQIWELTLPKIVNINEIEAYALRLRVPLGFGKPAYISPNPQTQKQETDGQVFTFDKESIANAGVVAAFGEFQVFDFNLKYHLSNTTTKTGMAKIALPPQTNYQRINYSEIKPKPENVEVDNDGNWLAWYILKPGDRIAISAKGQVEIFAQPQDFLQISSGDLNKYLEPQGFWEKNDPKIIELARKYKTPREIYDYVVRTLDYDYSRVRAGVKRLGALGALSAPNRAVCMEFTDLFIAIARAAGIPARELNGFAYTQNPVLQPLSLVEDVLHAWPEYYDTEKKSWIQIDPTWQNTTGGVDFFNKLDVGHFVFVVHGESSQTPFPAGSYKTDTSQKKDVEVTFGSYKEPVPSLIKADFLLPEKVMAERDIEGAIKVSNKGQRAIYGLRIDLVGQNLILNSSTQNEVAVLPPYGSVEIPVKAKVEKIFPQGRAGIILFGNNQKFEYNMAYESLILRIILPALGGLLAIFVLGIFTKKAWRIYLQKRQTSDDLHR